METQNSKKDFIDLIREIVREEISVMQKYDDNKINNFKVWVGTVDSVNSTDNTATIILPNQTVPTTEKMNKTGQGLIVGDIVELFSKSGNLGDSYISSVQKKYNSGITSYNAKLSSDVAIASAGTWYTGVSLALPVGTYLVVGQITLLRNTTTAVTYSAKITDGSSDYASSTNYQTSVANNTDTLPLSTIITLTSSKTISIQATGTQTATIKASLISNGAGNNATQLSAIQIA